MTTSANHLLRRINLPDGHLLHYETAIYLSRDPVHLCENKIRLSVCRCLKLVPRFTDVVGKNMTQFTDLHRILEGIHRDAYGT